MAFGIKWLKPELDELKYWFHLVILVLVAYFLIGKFIQPIDLTPVNIALGVVFLAIGDTIAHTILQLD